VTSFFASSDTQTPPSIIPDAAQGERRPNEPAFVGDGLPNTIAADPDDTFTHAHHVVPLSFQARADRSVVNHSHEWLCPTHHAAVHILIGRHIPHAVEARIAVTQDLGREGPEILSRALEIAGRARP
jgi:hypothetical protein